MISVVMSILCVAVGILRFGRVRSRRSNSVQSKLMVISVHWLSVRLSLVIVVVAVGRLTAVVAHVCHRGFRQSRGVLGAGVAAHRSGKICQNIRDLLLEALPGAHNEINVPRFLKQ